LKLSNKLTLITVVAPGTALIVAGVIVAVPAVVATESTVE